MKNFFRPLFLCVLLSAASSAHAEDVPRFPAPPRLATTRAELEKVKTAPDFAAVRAAALQTGDALLATPVSVPRGYGGWVFNYACPDDGTSLQMISPTEHQCPRDKKIYSDEKIVSAYRAFGHAAVENAVQDLGWAYVYSDDARYASEAKRLLLQLAHDYPDYPQRTDRWGHTGIFAMLGGRRYVQSLDEAVGIIRLAKGYDLTRSSKAWTEAEKTLVERDLFGLTAQTLLTFNQGINNHQTWYNAGLMAIASVRGDAELVRTVLTMRGGYRDQLERSIGADGLWYEGTMAYHSYALQAMIEIVDAGRRMNLPLQNEAKLKAMVEGPLRAAYPNGALPAINDSDRLSIDMFRGPFAWAFQTWGEARFDVSKGAMPVATISENLADAGLAVLRRGAGQDAACVFVDYGPHGGGHGHFDKLQMMLFANGREWLLDAGRLSYSQPEYKTWVKETAAHNTVSLGGASQNATTGKLLWLQNDAAFVACAVQSDEAYNGAKLSRRVLLADKFLVDIFDVEAPQETQIDWFAHSTAALQPTIKRESKAFAPGDANGYQHFKDTLGHRIVGNSQWDFSAGEIPNALRLRVWLVGDAGETIAVANGIGYNIDEKAPTLIRRRIAAKTRFIAVYDLGGKGDWIRGVQSQAGALPTLRLTTADGNWNIAFSDKGATMTKAK